MTEDLQFQLITGIVGLGLGAAQKHWFNGKAWYRPNIQNKWIPYLNPVLCMVVGDALGIGVGAGAIAGAASVGAHQAWKSVEPAKK
jgi:hypothetical protein